MIRAVTARHPNVRFEGVAGPQMVAAGCDTLYPMERLAVIGLLETLRRFRELYALRRRLIKRYTDNPPDLLIGIDAPDFNLSLEHALRRVGVPTMHYVSPQVWAWRRYRLPKIRRAVDMMLTLFPFEEKFFCDQGVAARFVGHPLADLIPEVPDQVGARRALALPADGEIVAILPGSRLSEVSVLAEPMIGAARWLARRRPQMRFIVALVDARVRDRFETIMTACGDGPEMRLHTGDARTVMAAADAVLLASGTASLEALLLKRPMVITYRLSRLSWWIARMVVKVPFAGLPNLLAGRAVVPELLQDDAEPEKMGTALLEFLDNPKLVDALKEEFLRIHTVLKNHADERAADAVLELIGAPAGGP